MNENPLQIQCEKIIYFRKNIRKSKHLKLVDIFINDPKWANPLKKKIKVFKSEKNQFFKVNISQLDTNELSLRST